MPSKAVILVLTVLFIVSGALAYLVSRKRVSIKAKRFKDRNPLSLENIYREYYPEYNANEVTSLWSEIADDVEVKPELLRPSDHFGKEIGPVPGFPIAGEFDNLEENFSRRCRDIGLNPSETTVKTVDEYMKMFLKAKGSNPQ